MKQKGHVSLTKTFIKLSELSQSRTIIEREREIVRHQQKNTIFSFPQLYSYINKSSIHQFYLPKRKKLLKTARKVDKNCFFSQANPRKHEKKKRYKHPNQKNPKNNNISPKKTATGNQPKQTGKTRLNLHLHRPTRPVGFIDGGIESSRHHPALGVASQGIAQQKGEL